MLTCLLANFDRYFDMLSRSKSWLSSSSSTAATVIGITIAGGAFSTPSSTNDDDFCTPLSPTTPTQAPVSCAPKKRLQDGADSGGAAASTAVASSTYAPKLKVLPSSESVDAGSDEDAYPTADAVRPRLAVNPRDDENLFNTGIFASIGDPIAVGQGPPEVGAPGASNPAPPGAGAMTGPSDPLPTPIGIGIGDGVGMRPTDGGVSCG